MVLRDGYLVFIEIFLVMGSFIFLYRFVLVLEIFVFWNVFFYIEVFRMFLDFFFKGGFLF